MKYIIIGLLMAACTAVRHNTKTIGYRTVTVDGLKRYKTHIVTFNNGYVTFADDDNNVINFDLIWRGDSIRLSNYSMHDQHTCLILTGKYTKIEYCK
jgi:hypothetical protein